MQELLEALRFSGRPLFHQSSASFGVFPVGFSAKAQGGGTVEPHMLWKVCERMSHTALLDGSLTCAEHLKGHTP